MASEHPARQVHADDVSYITVVIAAGLVSAIALIVPAWRAARVDPLVALRSE